MATTMRVQWLWAAAAVAVLAGCGSSDGPMASSPSNASIPQLSAADKAKQLEHERLKDSLRAVKEDFKARRAAHHDEFEQARAAWNQLEKEIKTAKKEGNPYPTDLLACEPHEYEGDAAIIGPNGGSIRVGDHELRVPAGALDHEVLITAEAPVSSVAVVNLEPHGLQFAQPVQLELSYRNCIQPPGWLDLFIVYLDSADRILEVNVSRDKKGVKSVVGDLEHFSRYAIAW